VALIVKQCASAVGLDAARLSGHSLRAGFVTNAAGRGASTSSIREQTGHHSDAMVQRYIRAQQGFKDNPISKIW
jgi:integrase